MARWIKVCGLFLAALLCVTTLQQPASAAKVPRVKQPVVASQSWYSAKVKVRWPRVKGATYQVRWSTSSKLRKARYQRVAKRTLTIGPVDRSRALYVQVRAIKKRKAGAWSRTLRTKFRNKWPAKPVAPRTTSDADGIHVSWGLTPYATRYRVNFAAAPGFQTWPAAERLTPWLGMGARSTTYQVPTDVQNDPTLTAVPFGNAIYTQVTAGSIYHPTAIPRSEWMPIFPTPPVPEPGAILRIGTYNVARGGSAADPTSGLVAWERRVPAIVNNIRGNDLSMVALQEIERNKDNVTDGDDSIVAALNVDSRRNWQTVKVPRTPSVSKRVIYDANAWTLLDHGLLSDTGAKIPNVKTDGWDEVPWAMFRSTDSSWTRPFLVVPVHFTARTSLQDEKTQANNNYDSGRYVQAVMAAIDTLLPTLAPTAKDPAVLIAGDFTVNHFLWGHPSNAANAHSTLVKSGYYNTVAVTEKIGTNYTTVNGGKHPQTLAANGVGPRPDAIFVKGFVGGNYYRNVANYTGGLAKPPSDHNLVLVELQVPNAE